MRAAVGQLICFTTDRVNVRTRAAWDSMPPVSSRTDRSRRILSPSGGAQSSGIQGTSPTLLLETHPWLQEPADRLRTGWTATAQHGELHPLLAGSRRLRTRSHYCAVRRPESCRGSHSVVESGGTPVEWPDPAISSSNKGRRRLARRRWSTAIAAEGLI